MKYIKYFLFLTLIISGCRTIPLPGGEEEWQQPAFYEFVKYLTEESPGFKIPPRSGFKDYVPDSAGNRAIIHFNDYFAARAYRENDIPLLYHAAEKVFNGQFDGRKLVLYCLGQPVEELVPNLYREDLDTDNSRLTKIKEDRALQAVRNISRSYEISNGLYDKNIALWHSHGWYYSFNSKRWEWQRPRLFQTVEDLIPMSITVPFIIPMLENAGANVYVPRERDLQTSEVVVDNDGQTGKFSGEYREVAASTENLWQDAGSGFAIGDVPYEANFNPFESGSAREIRTDKEGTARAEWIPDIPEDGFYAVYISWSANEKNISDALYTVYHEGGKTEFEINQQIGGKTWIYLGTFKFRKGKHQTGAVTLSNKSNSEGFVSADAVRFGGGMGIIKRNGETSGRPKFVEGARYYLQYAGMPDTLVYNLGDNDNDYTDDYRSRGEYVNYLKGAPFGPNVRREAEGLKIPIDLSMSFHTDAGISYNDTTIGTLAIYSLPDADTMNVFPDGISRMACRDLTDIIQTQIVDDIRGLYDPVWNRRGLRNADYSEAFRPNVPAILLELLSHQNFLDMKFMLDPRFKFDVGRAIYKGMLKFLSVQHNFEYAVQPLPVDHFSAEITGKNQVTLKWKPVDDPLEPTAAAQKYVVYTRKDDKDFDNGVLTDKNIYIINDVPSGEVFSYKVTAVNDGGESFPSEILSVFISEEEDSKNVLIVNGFDRIAPPQALEDKSIAGFFNDLDNGVPYKYDLGFTGEQFGMMKQLGFISNDSPGFGESKADMETKIIAGNTFDFTYIHGKSFAEAGVSFSSCSDESFESGDINSGKYFLLDMIYGEEKKTHWPKPEGDSARGLQFAIYSPEMMERLEDYLIGGGNLFISGSYIGSDSYPVSKQDTTAIKFVVTKLKFRPTARYASSTGMARFNADSPILPGKDILFNTEYSNSLYRVEAPGAIDGICGGNSFMRYSDNEFSAGSLYNDKWGVAALSFPFETILSEKQRNEFCKALVEYFQK